MKKILIFGKGQLGSNIYQTLKKKKFVVKITEKKKLDFLNPKKIIELTKKINPDLIINCAAMTNVPLCEILKKKAKKINSISLKYIGKIAKEKKIKVLHISSDYVFSGYKRVKYKENDKRKPSNYYGISKMLGESYLENSMCDYFIFRSSWIYANDGKNFYNTIYKKILLEKENIKVVNDQFGIPTSTFFISKIICNLLKLNFFDNKKNNGTYHVVPNGKCSWYEYSKFIEKFILKNYKKKKSKIIPITSKLLKSSVKRPKFSVLDNTKIKKYLDQKVYDWKFYLLKELKEKNA